MKWKNSYCAGLILISINSVAFADTDTVTPEATTIDQMSAIKDKKGWLKGCREIDTQLAKVSLSDTNYGEDWDRAMYLKAGCLSETRRDKEAILLLKEALKRSPKNHNFLNVMGTSYLRTGNDKQAVKLFTKALKSLDKKEKPSHITKEQFDQYKANIHSKVASAYLREGSKLFGENNLQRKSDLLSKAENHILKAMELDNKPDWPIRYAELAHVKMSSEEYAEAITLFEKAIVNIPNYKDWDTKLSTTAKAEYLMAMGQSLFLNGSKSDGESTMNTAIEIAPTDELKAVMRHLKNNTVSPLQSAKAEHELSGTVFIPLDE